MEAGAEPGPRIAERAALQDSWPAARRAAGTAAAAAAFMAKECAAGA